MIRSEKISRYRGRKVLMIAQRVLSFFVIPLLLGLCIGAVVCIYLYNKEAAKLNKFVYHEVTMDYAHPVTMSSFFTQSLSNLFSSTPYSVPNRFLNRLL